MRINIESNSGPRKDEESGLKRNEELVSSSIFKNQTAPKKLALIILSFKKIPKTILGEFFSNDSDFSSQVFFELTLFLQLQNNLIHIAFRKLLKHITMPHVSEKVDKIIQLFAQSYHKQNKDTFSETCAYGLTYLMVMLQSEIYNPLITEKMSQNTFIKLGMGIADYEKYLNPNILTEVYSSIAQKPLDWNDKSKQEKKEHKNRNNNSNSIFSFFKPILISTEPLLKKLVHSSKRVFLHFGSPTKLNCHHEEFLVLSRFFKDSFCSVMVVNLLMAFSDPEEKDFSVFENLIINLTCSMLYLGENDLLLQLFLGFIKFSEICSTQARYLLSDNNIFSVRILFQICLTHFENIICFFESRLSSFLRSFERFTAEQFENDPFLNKNAEELKKKNVIEFFWQLKKKLNNFQ